MHTRFLLKVLTLPLASFLFLSSCLKNNEDNTVDTCAKLKTAKAKPFAAVTIGQAVTLSADSVEDAYYYWTGSGGFQSYYQNPEVTSAAGFYDRGWFYLTITKDGCEDKRDSVYVDVKFPQGTPSCTPVTNTTTFGGPLILGNQNYSFVNFGAGLSGYTVTGNSTNGDITIVFSPYWNTHNLEDGIYYTSDISTAGSSPSRLFISAVNQSILWYADHNQPVYISHSGGKQLITFCNLVMRGSWGSNLYSTSASGKIKQP